MEALESYYCVCINAQLQAATSHFLLLESVVSHAAGYNIGL